MIVYVVRCEVDDADVAGEWVAWMRGGHLAEVLAAGALSAELVRLDRPVPTFEARYRFATLGAFEAYERDHAPRLRSEGLRRFPPSRGLRYERSLAELLAAVP